MALVPPEIEDADDRRFQDRGGARRRSEQRLRSLLPGLILFNGEDMWRNALILNRSDTGAKLSFDSGLLPEVFILIDQRAALAHKCRVVWKDMPQFGVIYVKTVDIKENNEQIASRLQKLEGLK